MLIDHVSPFINAGLVKSKAIYVDYAFVNTVVTQKVRQPGKHFVWVRFIIGCPVKRDPNETVTFEYEVRLNVWVRLYEHLKVPRAR